MAFRHISAPAGQRPPAPLSADNRVPDRYAVIDILRRAAPALGLKPTVLATLEVMLGCLPPARSHHTVFASNATLAFRRNNLTERTLRRHVVQLAELGLLARHDSPNGKRYSRKDAEQGRVLRFGFDLSPLFARLDELAALAASYDRQLEHLTYLRCKLRAAASAALKIDANDDNAVSTLRALRRKLTVDQCTALLGDFDEVKAEGEADPTTPPVSANDGQNVRHQQNSNTDNMNDERAGGVSVDALKSACPDALAYAAERISTPRDVVCHARTLAPMIGINQTTYDRAERALGPVGAAVAVWAIVEMGQRIRNAAAYFRALTSGSRHAGFDPFHLVRQMAARQRCPRTIAGQFTHAAS